MLSERSLEWALLPVDFTEARLPSDRFSRVCSHPGFSRLEATEADAAVRWPFWRRSCEARLICEFSCRSLLGEGGLSMAGSKNSAALMGDISDDGWLSRLGEEGAVDDLFKYQ